MILTTKNTKGTKRKSPLFKEPVPEVILIGEGVGEADGGLLPVILSCSFVPFVVKNKQRKP